MRISDWSSDVCSSDLTLLAGERLLVVRIADTERDPQLVRDDVDIVVHEGGVGLGVILVVGRVDLDQAARERHAIVMLAIFVEIIATQHELPAILEQDRKSTRLNSSH